MEWIKKDTRLPIEEKDGVRVLTFSPIYPKDSEMRHRIMNSQFVKICSEVTHWRKLDEPCEGKNVDARESNCNIPLVSQRSELLAFKRFMSKTPQAELEYYSDEEFTDLYLKANCG